MNEIYDFLIKLSENNNREWFKENKKQFDKLNKEFHTFIEDLLLDLTKIDKRLENITAKECVFRIYKDVRFSKDKTPYKTHFGAYMSSNGRKSQFAGYYLHFQPGDSFAGGGIHSPDKEVLNAVRTEIYNTPKEFLKIIQSDHFRKYFGEMKGEALKKGPRDFPKDFEYIDIIKHKQYLAMRSLSDEELLSPNFKEHLLEIFSAQKSFNDYLNKAIDNVL